MKMRSSLASVVALFAVVVSAPGQAAPPPKSPSAQIHDVTSASICAADGSSTMLNIPLANGNPNVVIVATINETAYSDSPAFYSTGLLSVFYDTDGTGCGNDTPGRWVLVVASATLVEHQRFNIIVMNPR
jgi:hypothetical protein